MDEGKKQEAFPRMVDIIINGHIQTILSGKYGFYEICLISSAVSRYATVQYSRGVNNSSGVLLPDQSVEVVDGMTFDIVVTNRA